MALVILVGVGIILLLGGGLPEVIIYIAIVGMCSTNYEDKNRRGEWWK